MKNMFQLLQDLIIIHFNSRSSITLNVQNMNLVLDHEFF